MSYSNQETEHEVILLANSINNDEIVSQAVNNWALSSSNNPNKVKCYPLANIHDLKIQEALIIKDLLYVFIGLEGYYIRYSEHFDPTKNNHQILGPDYKIAKSLDPSLKDIAKRLIKCGKIFYSLNKFIEKYEILKFGKICQAFCFEIKKIIKNYLTFINSIEYNFNFLNNYSLRILEQDILNSKIFMEITHIYEIVLFIFKENEKRQQELNNNFTNLIENIKKDLKETGSIDLYSDSSNSKIVKGGLILKLLQIRIENFKGDPKSFKFLIGIFNSISESYVKMLNDWLWKGEINNDAYDEFLIKQNNSGNNNTYNIDDNESLICLSENYWNNKFQFRKEGLLKQFDNREIQYKILLTGKYLNILKECGITINNNINDTEIGQIKNLYNNDLYLQIETAFKRSNKLIIDLYLKGYNFKSILQNLKRIYLIDNNYNFNNFLTLSINDLKKNRNNVSLTKLIRNFEKTYYLNDDEILNFKSNPDMKTRNLMFNLLNLTIKSENLYDYLLEILNVQPIDADEALSSSNVQSLKNLLNKTLEAERERKQSGSSSLNKIDDYVINGIDFEIVIPFPINLMITQTFITQYQLISRHLIIVMFIDKLLENSWREINFQKIWVYKFKNKKLSKWILKARSLHSKMKNFIKIFQFYLINDTIENNWILFENFLDKYIDNEDGYEVNNEEFLEFEKIYLNLQSFLSTALQSSILTTEKLINIFTKLFSIIILYTNFLSSLRKTLILFDEDLFNKYNINKSKTFNDNFKNLERFKKLNHTLKNYEENFNDVLENFIQGLRYYGELECSGFLILAERLEMFG
ncbi:hypothetical protein PACTADRAFT_63108 [Pachysolen tannophilus NRRL Y-2460]|uniref:Spindle pole body component n=1 Tax=Pachysolen tannophilus NRRL Y-2460 TaxID=669874 RepID=A0A1E4U0Y8_PACTA|nr:hypothetical protein PACTADRAFT_63108 [Pachysolen tannophilus NRRL Y-2460]